MRYAARIDEKVSAGAAQAQRRYVLAAKTVVRTRNTGIGAAVEEGGRRTAGNALLFVKNTLLARTAEVGIKAGQARGRTL